MIIDVISPDIFAFDSDCVIVVDVWRSFTTAAHAFAAGACDILITDSVEEAMSLRVRFPQAVLIGMGKLGGEPATGFDFGNSPAEVRELDWHDQRIILSTPNGTPGLVKNKNARTLLAGSLVCARATARYLKQLAPEHVTFVCTETGIADQACAAYMTALLRNEPIDTDKILGSIRSAGVEHGHALLACGELTEAQWKKLEADLSCCLELNLFDFAMVVERRDEALVMEAITGFGNKNHES